MDINIVASMAPRTISLNNHNVFKKINQRIRGLTNLLSRRRKSQILHAPKIHQFDQV
jgi:hypothetical protein